MSMTDRSTPLLDRAAEALWEAWMAQHKIAGGKEYASFADMCRYAKGGQEPAQHYLAAIYAEVRAVARVLLTEPPSQAMIAAWHDAYPPPGSTEDDDYPRADWSAMARELLADLSARRDET